MDAQTRRHLKTLGTLAVLLTLAYAAYWLLAT